VVAVIIFPSKKRGGFTAIKMKPYAAASADVPVVRFFSLMTWLPLLICIFLHILFSVDVPHYVTVLFMNCIL
jgi:hypothetical protein